MDLRKELKNNKCPRCGCFVIFKENGEDFTCSNLLCEFGLGFLNYVEYCEDINKYGE